MNQPSPRAVRIFLGFLLSAGLVLRLWGLNWGDLSLHPDEWPFIVIYQISRGDFSEIGQSVWYNVYHMLAALVALAVQKTAYLTGTLFNLYRLEAEVPMNYIFIGRLTSALLGTMTIYLVYRTGRLLFQNTLLGLLAALIFTIAPLNVVQTHYLETDVPLAFMASLCFLGAFRLLDHRTKGASFWAGLLYGLTFSTKPNGLMMILPFLVVLFYWIRGNPSRAGLRHLIPLVLVFVGAAFLGILLGAPGLVLNFSKVITPMVSFVWNLSQIKPRGWTGNWLEGPQASRFGWALHFLREGFGLPWMILAALGIGYWLYRREKAGLLLVSFPLGYFFIVGLWGRRFGERDLVILMPFLSLLAASVLVRVFAPGRANRLRDVVGALLVLGLSITPLVRSMQLDYLYWQDDNRIHAMRWIERNIPPGTPLGLDGYAPKHDDFPQAALDYRLPPEAYVKEVEYLITSSMDVDRFFSLITGRTNDPEGRHALALQQKFQLIKEFDLNFPGPSSKQNGSFNFPDFVNPLIRIYATRAVPVRLPIFFPRLTALSGQDYTLSFSPTGPYEKDTGAFIIPPGRGVKRVLRTADPLERVLVIVSNGPHTRTKLTISSGWRSRRLELAPREVRSVLFKPGCSFPYLRNLYGLEIRTQGDTNLWGQVLTDPFSIGVHLLQDRQPREARPFLEQAVAARPNDLDRKAFLAAALAAAGDKAAARRSFQEIESRAPAYWSQYLQVSLNRLPYPEWLRHFAEVSGYYHPLLQQATRYRHVVPPEVRFFTLEDKQEVQGDNFVAASQVEPDGTPAIKLWSRELFPRGPFQARFRIKFHRPWREGGRIIRVDVLKHSHEGLVVLGEKKIFGKGPIPASGTWEEFTVPFHNPVFGGNFEFRVFSLDKNTDFTLQEVEVSLDLRQSLRENLNLFLEAWTKVADPTDRESSLSRGLPGPEASRN